MFCLCFFFFVLQTIKAVTIIKGTIAIAAITIPIMIIVVVATVTISIHAEAIVSFVEGIFYLF